MCVVVEGEILEEDTRTMRDVCLEVADTCNALAALALSRARGRDGRYWTGVAMAFQTSAWMCLAPVGSKDGETVLEKSKQAVANGRGA